MIFLFGGSKPPPYKKYTVLSDSIQKKAFTLVKAFIFVFFGYR